MRSNGCLVPPSRAILSSDPVIRRKTKEILQDPEDFDTISSAVSPDNLCTLKSLTIQSGHTHNLAHRSLSPDQLSVSSSTASLSLFAAAATGGGSQSTVCSYKTTGGVSLSFDSTSTPVANLDFTTNQCYPGYATIRRRSSPKEAREQDQVALTNSVPNDVHLIGASTEATHSQSNASTRHRARQVRDKSKTLSDSRPPVAPSAREVKTMREGRPRQQSSSSAHVPERESRSAEIDAAIAQNHPASFWADYFPENLSPNSTVATPYNQNSVADKEQKSPVGHAQVEINNEEEQQSTTPIGGNSNEASPEMAVSSPEEWDDKVPEVSPMCNRLLNDSLTDEEVSPSQQTQHFNSPVLGATQRNLFFPSHPSIKHPSSIPDNPNPSSFSSDQSSSSYTDDREATKVAVRSSSKRRDSFEKVNNDNDFEDEDDDDDDSVGNCYILKSLETAAPLPPPKPAPEVDVASATILATRLYYLNGFDLSDVPKHLGKKLFKYSS